MSVYILQGCRKSVLVCGFLLHHSMRLVFSTVCNWEYVPAFVCFLKGICSCFIYFAMIFGLFFVFNYFMSCEV